MKKIVTLLIAITLVVACKKDKGAFNSNPLLYKSYISGFSQNVISANSPFQITFNSEIPQEKLKKIADLDLFSISPGVDGKVVALSPYEVQFIPKERLEQDKEYRVTFYLDELFPIEDDELKTFRFTTRTKAQSYSFAGEDLQSYSSDFYFLNSVLLANDEISAETAKKLISAKVGGKNIPVKISGTGNSNSFSVILDSIPRSSKEQTLEVLWNSDYVSAEDPKAFEFTVPQKDKFQVVNVLTPDSSNQSFWVNFSDPIDKNQDFSGMVSVEGVDTMLKYSANGNVLKVFSDTPMEGEREISVHQGIRSVYNSRLGNDFTYRVTFMQQKPEIRLVRNGTILPSSENLKINFQTINLRAVNVTVYRIYENNILQFLQENSLRTTYSLNRVAKPIAKKVIQLTESAVYPLKNWNTYALDLSTLITPEPGAIYTVEFGMKKNYSLYNCGGEEEPLDLSFEEESLETDGDYYDSDYYYWGDDSDPCQASYYTYKSIKTNVLASDLGVVVKMGQNNNYTFAVSDIVSASPVNGALVEVYDFQQQKIQEGRTDKQGLVSLKLSSKGAFAIVKNDKNTTYVKIDNANALSLSKYNVDGVQLQEGLNGYIYADRGVWRPGDSIHVGFILNDFSQKTPEKLPIKLTFTDPYGKVIAERMQQSNPSNHYVFSLKTSDDAQTGVWNIRITAGAARFYKALKIETVKPNRLKINNSLNGQLITSKGENGKIKVEWLHGSPAGNTQIEVKAKFYTDKTSFKGYEKYIFDNQANIFGGEEKAIYNGKTDADGNATFFFDMETYDAPGMLRVNFLTQANEEGGDFSTDVASAKFSPYGKYVGLSLPEPNKYGYHNTEENHNFDVIVLSEEGKPLSNQDVKVAVYKVGWNWWWDASNQNISTYNSSSSNAIYAVKSITTNGNGKANFNLQIPDADWGRYFILLEQNSGHKSGTIAYFDWGSWSGKSKNTDRDQAVMLALGTDKKEYNVGDKAKISFPSSEGSRALISIENGSEVIETHWVETTKNETVFELKMTEKMAPNVYAFVTLLQPHATTKNDAPIRLYGVLPISVYDKETKLEPQIKMADVLRPEQKTKIKVSEKSGKAMTYTLAIVEDGLLNLTRFKTPNPWDNFFAKTALGVKTWDIYDDVIGAYGGTINQVFSIGGDEDLGGAEAQKANRFKPFVIFKGPFKLKSGSSNTHEIDIPNYIGSARVMVVASDVDKNAYGGAEKSVPVRSPLMVLGSLPRKAVPGEKITLPVTVFAMEDNIKNVSISINTNKQFQVSGNHSQSLYFENPSEKMAFFELNTKDLEGIGKVTITATSGNEKATYEVEMGVYNPNPTTYVVESKAIGAGQTADLKASIFGEKGSKKTTLEISSFPGVNLTQRLNYLIKYPHGCSEQLTSQGLPQLYVSDFVSLNETAAANVQRNVSSAIAKLHESQLSNGGFSYWKGSRYADEWVTSYIGQFYIEAEKRGYVLPVGSKQQWLNYQTNEVRQWRNEPKYGNDFLQAYRLYTLALAGNPDLPAMNRLREIEDLSTNAKWRLAAAYALAGHQRTAESLFQTTSVDFDSDGYYYYYGSDVRNKAMALETALLLNKQTEAGEWAYQIAEKLSYPDWMSTQTTAYALYAMAKYVQKNSSGKQFTATYSLSGKSENINSNEPLFQRELQITEGNSSLRVKNTSKQTLYVKLISSGVLPVGQELPMQNGLSITTDFRDTKGKGLNKASITQGTAFVETIKVTNLTGERVDNIALTQLIPSGWEIVNVRYTDYGESQTGVVDYTDFRDDRANFYFSLKGGETKFIKLQLNASYAGKYYLPGTYGEAMYNNRYNTRTEGEWVEVIRGN